MKRFSPWIVPLFILLLLISNQIRVNAEDVYVATPVNPNYHQIPQDDIINALRSIKSSPRLLLTPEAISRVKHKLEVDPRWKMYYEALKNDADKRLNDSPVEYKLEGIRLLQVSRQALKRIFAWSFLYRYTGDEKYAKRVEKELVAISEFSDWHPQHYLDVAEMTVAVAIGYDSCKDTFTPDNKQKVRDAIWKKGILETRYNKGWWKRNTANWNQVCWCGNLYGALALYEDSIIEEERQILTDAITDSLNGITWSMSSYQPDGNYTEGPGYWGYGTGFNILFFEALETALGNNFGLSEDPGFLRSIQYYEHVFGTTGNAFNYPDSGGGKMFEATAFWYSAKLNDPNIVWNENQAINNAYLLAHGKIKGKGYKTFNSLIGDRVSVCALLWGPELDSESISRLDNYSAVTTSSNANAPEELGYVGLGNELCCVALYRNSWDPNSAYLGIKCGRPNAPHGHLDAGSLVYDDLGVRWLVELGPENYTKIEQLGMNLWDMSQKSDRWKLLRYNNFGHSVPTINNQLQLVDQKSVFTETQIGKLGEESFAIIDLTPVYKNDVTKIVRKTTLEASGELVVEDTIEALPDHEAYIERRFLSPAKVEINDNVVILTIPDPHDENVMLKKVIRTQSDVQTSFEVIPCTTDNEIDAPNPGISILIEKSKLLPGQQSVYRTSFTTEE